MNILFLDVDGVLNSTRSAYGLGGLPHGTHTEQLALFDHIAIGLIRLLCKDAKAKIVLSSSWRLLTPFAELGKALDLPIIDATDREVGPRGEQIQRWLDKHPGVKRYAIVDDDRDMLQAQMPYFVKTNNAEGLLYSDFMVLRRVFGLES
jgi:hypothetical protein